MFENPTFLPVTFNVVGYPNIVTGSFGVSVDGKVTKLTTTSTTFPLWSGTVSGASASTTYKYVELDSSSQPTKEENFTRSMQNKKSTMLTRNEFFDREEFVAVNGGDDIPQVPLVYDPWQMSHTRIFEDDTQVATIHLMADAEQFESMLQAPMEMKQVQVYFRYINDKIVHNVNNVTFTLSGKSSMEFNKMTFKLKFDTDNNQTFFSRPSVKLVRSDIYSGKDVLNAVGVPTQQGAWVRLYVNSRPIGLYLMVDDIGKSFLKQTIHHGDHTINRGSLWQMNAPVVETQGDLQYIGPTAADYPADCYKMKTLSTSPELEPMAPMIQLMKDLQDFDPNALNGIEYWEERIDLDGFLRKYGGKWQWISTDFDGTFGDGDPTEVLTTYQTYADFSQHDRPMISKLILKNKDINARFETTLKEIVGWAFKPEALFPRLDAYEKLLAKDVEWEYSIDRSRYPGKTNSWTIQDFHQSLIGPVKDMNLGIRPWIQNRTLDLQSQLQFRVEPGTPDRVKRPLHRPKGGDSSVEIYSSAITRPEATSRIIVFVLAFIGILCSNIL
ncbi:hypothetical protein BGX26_007813 [Mortierella sp. AD094]|nr:hypothetical protein BGX26_007813 [Mortierella sp. AD094]